MLLQKLKTNWGVDKKSQIFLNKLTPLRNTWDLYFFINKNQVSNKPENPGKLVIQKKNFPTLSVWVVSSFMTNVVAMESLFI